MDVENTVLQEGPPDDPKGPAADPESPRRPEVAAVPPSERFKVELNGLPKYFNVGDAKKLVGKKLGLRPTKFKPVGRHATWMFLYFSSDDACQEAIAKLQGYEYKGRPLRAFMAKAKKDPFAQAVERGGDDRGGKASADQARKEAEAARPAAERIKDAVCALSDLSYDQQLASKMQAVKKIANKLRREVVKMLPVLREAHVEVGQVEPFVPSPVTSDYRNKCEFTVGRHPDTGVATVGFRLASYKKGSVGVVGVDDLPVVSSEVTVAFPEPSGLARRSDHCRLLLQMKRVVHHFETFVRESGFDPYCPVTQQGHWHQLTVRSNRKKELMVWAFMNPQGLSDDDREAVTAAFQARFSETGGPPEVHVTSLYIQFQGQRVKGEPESPVRLLRGRESLTETLMDGRLTFEISPRSFFQVNVDAAEKLYRTCVRLADLTPDRSVLLDVCCGTGTIGLCMAEQCWKVVGVDIVEEAVENARKNAATNGVLNTEYHAGKAEHLLPDLLKRVEDAKEVVAVVDPPRAGLHIKAVTALRTATNIQRLVYVSCDANAAFQSLVALARPPSNTYRGDPFVPKRIVPVDLFPHTRHFELVILFERFQIQ